MSTHAGPALTKPAIGEEDLRRDAAIKAIEERRGFYIHAASYVVVVMMLWAMWVFDETSRSEGGDVPWPLWVTGFWGLGVVIHGINAFMGEPSEEAIAREIERREARRRA